MDANKLLHEYLTDACPEIHSVRLQAIMDVAYGLQKSQDLSLTAIGKNLDNKSKIKHRIKKVDRLESNKHLHDELGQLYAGLSNYIFTYVSHEASTPIIVDLCFMQDNYGIQMLSAEVAIKGRSLPLYREIFKAGELKNKAKEFLSTLKNCIPENKKITIIMDAGFGEDWLEMTELLGWSWLIRVREGKKLQIEPEGKWLSVKDFIPMIGIKSKSYHNAKLMRKHERMCRVVTVRPSLQKERRRPKNPTRNDKAGGNHYRKSSKEPWILATNLPMEYKATQIIGFYKRRMQIEESFRDLKSPRFGLSARYICTSCIHRWGVKMLLAAITQIVFWVIGVIGHSQNFQKVFQANTVKDKKVFSYFYLGQMIIEYNKLDELKIDHKKLITIIRDELAREW